MRARDILALVIVVIITIGGHIMRGDQGFRPPDPEAPRRPPPSGYANTPWDAETQDWLREKPASVTPVLPSWLGQERESLVEIPHARRSGTGTAFAIGGGQWLTARHVVDGCDAIGLQYAPGKAVRVTDVRNHPHADLSLLSTKHGPRPFQLGDGASQGDNGFMIGFPNGRPGALHGRKIGTTTLRERGRYQTREPADVWSEQSRLPARTGSLGGLSGGPVFTSDGRIGGVVLAESARRGRIIAAQPMTLKQMLGSTPASFATPVPLNETSYPATARNWLISLQISKVLCRVS